MPPKEVIEIRRVIFADYCNQRDRIKAVMHKNSIQLTAQQAERVLALARKSFRQRESQHDAIWYRRYQKEITHFLMAIQSRSWPLFRGAH
jgi:hypothetical protein